MFFRSDADGLRDEVVFELGDLRTTPAAGVSGGPFNMPAYSVSIVKAGVTLATISVPKHYWRSRWRWQSAPRPVTTTPAALIAANLLPKYRASAVTGTPDFPGTPVYTPMTLAGIAPHFPDTGERPDIGPVSEYHGRYLCLGGLDADLAAMRAQLEGSSTIPWHYRDPATGAPINVVTNWPTAQAFASGFGLPYLAQDITGTGITMESAHVGAHGYLPFLLTGDPYALEEMQFADAFALIEVPAASRGSFSITQTRAMAWTLRTRMQLAKVTPAAVPAWLLPRTYFQTFLNQERDFILSTMVNNPAPEFANLNIIHGSSWNTSLDWPILPGTYLAPWEQDFFSTIAGWTVIMGNSDWAPIHAFAMKNNLARTAGTSGWPRARPSAYQTPLRASGGSTFQGAISGTTLTVTCAPGTTWDQLASKCTGGLAAGVVITGTGTGTAILAGTSVVQQLNSTEADGAPAKTGVYQVTNSQNVPLRGMAGSVTPFVTDWGAAWRLRKAMVPADSGPDPVTLVAGDQGFPSYAQAALAIANSVGTVGALAAYTWLHGQLVSLAAIDPRTNQVAYKWSIAPS